MRRLPIILTMAALATTACGDDPTNDAFVGSPTTTTIVTTSTTTTTTTLGTRPTPPPTTTTTTAVGRGPAEAVVASGTSPAGPWQLVARREPTGVLCALVRVQLRDAGPMVCNEASETDFNGNATLRYGVPSAGDSLFLVGVGVPGVARVRIEVRDGTAVEGATVPAPFTTEARFVAVPLPAGSVIRALVALDSSGRQLTRITVNP